MASNVALLGICTSRDFSLKGRPFSRSARAWTQLKLIYIQTNLL